MVTTRGAALVPRLDEFLYGIVRRMMDNCIEPLSGNRRVSLKRTSGG